jgi:DNA-damage-inducible protein J
LRWGGRSLKIPFEISAAPFYSPANQERLRKAAAEMDAGAGTVHGLTDAEDKSTEQKSDFP